MESPSCRDSNRPLQRAGMDHSRAAMGFPPFSCDDKNRRPCSLDSASWEEFDEGVPVGAGLDALGEDLLTNCLQSREMA